MLRKVLLFTCFVMLLCFQVVCFASGKVVTTVYYSQPGGFPLIQDSWYDDVAGVVNKRLSSSGIEADPVSVPWKEFSSKYVGKVVNKDLANAEWGKFLRSRYDLAVNVYVDKYLVNKDETVDAGVMVSVIRPEEFDSVLAFGTAKVSGQRGKKLEEALADVIDLSLDQCHLENLNK